MANWKINNVNKYTSPPFNVGDVVVGDLNENGNIVNVIRDFNGKHTTFGFAKRDLTEIVADSNNSDSSKKIVIKSLKSKYGLIIGSTLGMITGLFIAHHKDKKGWGYLGFAIIGAIAGSALGAAVDYVIKKKSDATSTNIDNTDSLIDSKSNSDDAAKLYGSMVSASGKSPITKDEFIKKYSSLSEKGKLAAKEYVDLSVQFMGKIKKGEIKKEDAFKEMLKIEPLIISKYGESALKELVNLF